MKNNCKPYMNNMDKFFEKGYHFPGKIFHEMGLLGQITSIEVKNVFNRIKDSNIEPSMLERMKMLVDAGLNFEVNYDTQIVPDYWKGILWDVIPTGPLDEFKQEEALFEAAIEHFKEIIRKDISELYAS